jgi:hypothetical protein
MSAADKFVPLFHAYDKFNDEPDRLVFVVGRKAKGSRKWVMYRCSVQCFESGSWSTAEDAMAWGNRLTSRRPVRWEANR